MEPLPHLDDDTLAAYVDGRLAVGELGRVDRHIDACGSCRRELSTLAAISSEPRAALGAAPTGTLGRYHVLRELGRGAMGIVLRAYDPELARAVAIKLLTGVDEQTRELLRREARALAKLRHPNVVTVYDVGVEADALYLAMELVEGDTLRGWCAGKSAREIREACIRAGRGLAAAHDAGVIHRDFKPENVLCGPGGEVKVSDFGLARAADESPDRMLAGTPAYMAPEVLRREVATAASDQFSYCVAVHELLTGERPTAGAVAAHAALPAWIARVLRRGLERDPALRFPSMAALVAALDDDPGVRRRRRILLASGALAAVAAGAAIMQLMPSQGASCALDASALGDAWTPARRQAVQAAIATASDTETAQRVVRALDDHADRWLASRRAACHTPESHTIACLDRNRRELGALAVVLVGADRKLAGSAQEIVGKLADPQSCDASAGGLPDDAAGRVAAESTRTLLARATALQLAGKNDEADRLARALPGADALFLRARADVDRGQYDRAEQLLFEALQAAERAHDDALAATLWVEIVATTGAQAQRFDLALSNARAADAALARVEPSVELRMRYGYALGALLLGHGQLDEARKRLEPVVTLAGDEPRRQASRGIIELLLCDIDRQQGKLPAAHERCTTGMARLERALGSDHIRVAISLSQTGALAYTEHDLGAAEQAYQRAIAIFEKRGATDHVAYAQALANLAAVAVERSDLPRAHELYTRSLAMFDASHPTHPQRLQPLNGLASMALLHGNPAEAIPFYVMIRDTKRATLAPEHPGVLAADFNLALAYKANKQTAEATALLEQLTAHALTPGKESWMIAARSLDLAGSMAGEAHDHAKALALQERALAAMSHVSASVERAEVLAHIGVAQIDLRRPEQAIAPLEEALAIYTSRDGNDYERGTTRYLLGRALVEAHRDPTRGVALVREASGELARARVGDGLVGYRAHALAWLQQHAK